MRLPWPRGKATDSARNGVKKQAASTGKALALTDATPAPRRRPAAGRATKHVAVPIEFGSKHGHQIFVYKQMNTNQIVYSLTKILEVRLPRPYPY